MDRPPNPRASYAVLCAAASDYRLEYYQADYDQEAAVAAAQRQQYPGADFISKHMCRQPPPLV